MAREMVKLTRGTNVAREVVLGMLCREHGFVSRRDVTVVARNGIPRCRALVGACSSLRILATSEEVPLFEGLVGQSQRVHLHVLQSE